MEKRLARASGDVLPKDKQLDKKSSGGYLQTRKNEPK
jgi:hypothetical protein